VLTSTPPTAAEPSGPPAGSQGAEANYTIRGSDSAAEPLDHAVGRSRGGLSTKIHQLVDGKRRPLVIALTGGQAGDSPVLKMLLADLAVARLRDGRPSPGRPRTRPDALLGDKAYSSRANRALLRTQRVKTVIPQRADEIGHRQRRGSAGGRPPVFDPVAYKGRNVVERSFNDHKQWRGLATRYDKLATNYRGAVVLRAITLWLRE
jgi:transposase